MSGFETFVIGTRRKRRMACDEIEASYIRCCACWIYEEPLLCHKAWRSLASSCAHLLILGCVRYGKLPAQNGWRSSM